MRYGFIFLFIFSIILIFIILKKITQNHYWLHQPVFYYKKKKQNDSKILVNLDKFKLTRNDEKIKNIIYKKYENIDTINQYNIIQFLNKYYNDDLIFTEELLKKIITKHNITSNYVFDYCFQEDVLIGLLFSKYISLKINGKDYKTVIVDYGCIHPKFQRKRIFTNLINRVIENMQNIHYPIAIHKSDDKPLPQKHHLKIEYRIISIPTQTKSIPLNKLTINNINNISFDDITEIFKQYKIYYNFDIKSFNQEFVTELPHCLTIINSDPLVLINGYFQNYNLNSKATKIFEIRYVLYSKLTNNTYDIIKNMIHSIAYNYDINKFVFQNIGGNIVLNKIFKTIFGHTTYIYIYNYDHIPLKSEEFFFNF